MIVWRGCCTRARGMVTSRERRILACILCQRDLPPRRVVVSMRAATLIRKFQFPIYSCVCWQVLGKDASEATAAAGFLLGLLDDYDALLSSDSSFQLGPWIAWARSWRYAGLFLTTRKRREKGWLRVYVALLSCDQTSQHPLHRRLAETAHAHVHDNPPGATSPASRTGWSSTRAIRSRFACLRIVQCTAPLLGLGRD